MKKLSIFLLFLLMCLMGPNCQAQESAAELFSLYGQDLMTVPSTVRLKFQNDSGTSWYDASMKDKEAFLLEWEKSRKAAIASKAIEDKKRLDLDKATAKAEADRKKKAADLAKIEAARLKKIADDKRKQDKQTADLIKKRKKVLDDLKKLQSQRNKKLRR